ncbi:leucyl aminopeptidase [Roseibium sp. RKSG952]|uniref:leucyl aminopeptidase n=1 Tax=Roseibium sp. RKSG952 TaxID=2529384 RepID=UPI0012BC4E05|nr:leucyl aminopeptidase [Roseibium sp. RKSG952]MTH95762.1 leucyl aminopeptidase [Roseibium sp. RKSG952]
MSQLPKLSFGKLATPKSGTAVVFAGEDLAFGELSAEFVNGVTGGIERAAKVAGFKGKKGSHLDLIAPAGLEVDRLIVVGIGSAADMDQNGWTKLGGTVMAALKSAKAEQASIVFEPATVVEALSHKASAFALGIKLAAYNFDTYKTKAPVEDDADKGKDKPVKIDIAIEDAKAAKKAWEADAAISDGVCLARDLVNEPANMLGPVEFAKKAAQLEKLGVEVEILGEKEMKKLKMNALLGVAQGSVRPAQLAIMRWNGGKKDDKPLAFVGKGVVFDTGGISIKPGAGMDEMKGDMGGAATVTGLMHALAGRKAKVNAVGVIGLVENMPDGNAQRPGDIVTAMSGTTIEILNTDAEGRLVLADALWYTQERFKPALMIDLATLTGAVIIALGNHNAGLFTNNDGIAEQLTAAGQSTEELVWRLPLSKDYDKLIDTPNADVKNIGGRSAGSITAAQFLQRFVNDVPWAHLDIAGTAMGAPKTEINTGWASGFGVRLLDRFVADNYEG